MPETAYWFALRTFDEAGNGSALSNVVQATTLASSDVLRPAPITLALVSSTNTSVTVAWTDSRSHSTQVASFVRCNAVPCQ